MRSTSENGLTLIECVAAIAIVGTAIVAGLMLFGNQQVAAAHQAGAWKALRYLGSEAERVRVRDYKQLQASGFAALPEDPDYEVQYAVEQVSASCRQVTITVRWASLSGLYSRRSLVTIRCQDVE